MQFPTNRLLAGATFCAVMLCAACASGLRPAAPGLPSVAMLDARAVSGTSDTAQDGIDAFLSSPSCVPFGSKLFAASSAGVMEWAIYRLQPEVGFNPLSVDVLVSSDEAWIGIAEFASMSWQIGGPWTAQQSINLDAGSYVSPGGYVYVALMCSGPHSMTITSVTLHASGNLSPVASFTATPQMGSPGEPVALDASGSADPDGSVVKYEWDLDGDGLFELDKGSSPLAVTTTPADSLDMGLRVTDNLGKTGSTTMTLTTAWQAQTIDGGWDLWSYHGSFSSLALINGNPAIAYVDNGSHTLRYVRSTNPDGTVWGPPLTIHSGNTSYEFLSLAQISGKPSVSYYTELYVEATDVFLGFLSYARALDENGSDWGQSLIVDDDPEEQSFTGQFNSLAEVNGKPAISYYYDQEGDLRYVRAKDANGYLWADEPQTLDSEGTVGFGTSLEVVNGKPAISYADYDNWDLKYIRANDPDGTAWDVPQVVDAVGDVGEYNSLTVVNGKPAIAYNIWMQNNDHLQYVRANDPEGMTWGLPQTLDSGAPDVVEGLYPSLCIVDGKPAISYLEENLASGTDHLKYITAGDLDGVVWGSPQVVDGDHAGGFSSMVVMSNGKPAISYDDGINYALKFAFLK